MSQTAQRLTHIRQNLTALQKIQKRMDPASGITVTIQRGPISDENTERPVSMELCEGLEKILAALIESCEHSVLMNERFCQNELAELKQVLGES